MPIFSKEARKNFRWQLDPDSGLPVAPVWVLNGVSWLACCPLCGGMHETRQPVGSTYEPACLLITLASRSYSTNWKLQLEQWRKQWPDSAAYRAVALYAADRLPSVEVVKARKRKTA